MSLSDPRLVFGVHSFTPYNRETGDFYGIMRVLGGSTINVSSELIKLTGGSSKYPWAIAEGAQNAEIQLKVKEYPDFLFELFGGKAPTSASTDSAGAVSALTNKKGSSVMNATTGIASIAVKAADKADLKFGKYVVRAVSATTVDVFLSTDIDIKRGADLSFQNDSLKVTSAPLTITASGTIALPSLGLEFSGGSGTIAMVSGDTAVFEVKPPSSKSMEVRIGSSTDFYPEFGAIAIAARAGDKSVFEVELFRCKGAGLPIGLEENAFSEPELKAEAFFDSTEDCVMKVRTVTPSV